MNGYHGFRTMEQGVNGTKSTIRKFYVKAMMEGKLHPDWKRTSAGYFFDKGIIIEKQIANEKNQEKIIAEFLNIIKKILKSKSKEQMFGYVISSIFVIEKLILKTTTRAIFRDEIINRFFKNNNIDMIIPAKGDAFNPQFHEVVGGRGNTYRVKILEMPGFKEESGKVIKKAMVVLE